MKTQQKHQVSTVLDSWSFIVSAAPHTVSNRPDTSDRHTENTPRGPCLAVSGGMTNPLNAASVTPIDRSASTYALAGSSFAVQTVNRAIHALSRSDAHVLVCGEAGTGKREWARVIHDNSPR